jgi:quercetin dioxygenase-like cupin family protein
MPSFSTSVLLRSEDSGGHVSVVENEVPARWDGPPLHHHDFDEAFYLLEGELTFRLGEDELTAGPGELVFAPRNAVHTLANRTDAPARYLLVITPAGFERRFDRMAAELAGVEPPPTASLGYAEVVVVGPPIGAG